MVLCARRGLLGGRGVWEAGGAGVADALLPLPTLAGPGWCYTGAGGGVSGRPAGEGDVEPSGSPGDASGHGLEAGALGYSGGAPLLAPEPQARVQPGRA